MKESSQNADYSTMIAALALKFDKANIDTDSTMAADSDVKVPSQKATKTALAVVFDSKSDISHNHSGVYEPVISDKNTAFNKDFGTATNTVCQGNDSRLSDTRTPTSHNNSNHSETYITSAGVTYENLNTNGDVGSSSGQLAIGNHNHSGVYEPVFTKNTAFNKNFGTGTNTVCQGNDSRLSDVRTPASHNNTNHSETYITSAGVTYENLNTNGDVGASAGQLAIGNHNHYSTNQMQSWFNALTFTRDDNTTINCSTTYIGNFQSYNLVGHLVKWLDSSDGVKIAWITGRYIGSGYCYLYLNGDPVESTDDLTSFQISLNEKVQVMDWFIPGEQVADSSNSAGKEYVTPYNIRIISCSGYVGTAASGTGAALTYDIYDDGTGIFSTDPSFGTNSSVTNSVPSSDIVITAGSRISLRTPTAAGATTKPQNLNVLMYYCINELLSAA